MNQATRKQIQQLTDQLEDIMHHLTHFGELELEKFENMPEGLQESEQGEALEEAGDTLQQAAHELLDIIETIKTAAE